MIYFEKELVEKLINKYSYYFNNFDKKDPRLYAFPALLSKSLTTRSVIIPFFPLIESN